MKLHLFCFIVYLFVFSFNLFLEIFRLFKSIFQKIVPYKNLVALYIFGDSFKKFLEV